MLDPALDELRSALNITDGAGVFWDVPRVLRAIKGARCAIRQAEHLATLVEWPKSEDYRR